MLCLNNMSSKNLIFIPFVILFIAASVILDQRGNKIEKETIEFFENLDSNKINQISIYKAIETYEDKGKPPIVVLSDISEINEFVLSLNNMQQIHPSHPHYIQKWEVVLAQNQGDQERLSVFLDRDDNNSVHVKRYRGAIDFESKKLNTILKKLNLIEEKT